MLGKELAAAECLEASEVEKGIYLVLSGTQLSPWAEWCLYILCFLTFHHFWLTSGKKT